MRRFYEAGSSRQRLLALCACAVALALPAGASAADSAPGRSLASAAKESAQRVVAKVWEDAQDVTQFALGLIGVEYRYGGETPDRGLDCSGLIRYVFQEVTGVTLPRTARELARIGENVRMTDLQVGDLVFFNTRHFAFSHVGLYLGDNRFIHAPARGREVEITTLSANYWQKHFDGARRLVGVLPALIPSVIPEALAASLQAPPALAASLLTPPASATPATPPEEPPHDDVPAP